MSSFDPQYDPSSGSPIDTPFTLSPDHFAAHQAVVSEPEQSFYDCLSYPHVRMSFHYIGM